MIWRSEDVFIIVKTNEINIFSTVEALHDYLKYLL